MTATPTPDETLTLKTREAVNLAAHLVARHVQEADWLEWGDLPMLDERSFDLVVAAVKNMGDDLVSASNLLDAAQDIDSRDLLSRAS